MQSKTASPVSDDPAANRRWRRFHFDVPVRLFIEQRLQTMVVHGRGTEINEGGLGVHAGVELAIGDKVEMELTAPYCGLPLRVRGVVRNAAGSYYGVEFLTANPSDEQDVDLLRQTLRNSAGLLGD